jgi:hypothetical protein
VQNSLVVVEQGAVLQRLRGSPRMFDDVRVPINERPAECRASGRGVGAGEDARWCVLGLCGYLNGPRPRPWSGGHWRPHIWVWK